MAKYEQSRNATGMDSLVSILSVVLISLIHGCVERLARVRKYLPFSGSGRFGSGFVEDRADLL